MAKPEKPQSENSPLSALKLRCLSRQGFRIVLEDKEPGIGLNIATPSLSNHDRTPSLHLVPHSRARVGHAVLPWGFYKNDSRRLGSRKPISRLRPHPILSSAILSLDNSEDGDGEEFSSLICSGNLICARGLKFRSTAQPLVGCRAASLHGRNSMCRIS